MRRPIVIEDPDERARRQREEEEDRVLDHDERWEAGGARRPRPVGRLGSSGGATRARSTCARRPPRRTSMSPAAIAEAVDLVDPTGARRTTRLSPAGHVALFVRALHAPGAAALRRAHG